MHTVPGVGELPSSVTTFVFFPPLILSSQHLVFGFLIRSKLTFSWGIGSTLSLQGSIKTLFLRPDGKATLGLPVFLV